MKLIDALRRYDYNTLHPLFEQLGGGRDYRAALMNIKTTRPSPSSFTIHFQIVPATEESAGGVFITGSSPPAQTGIALDLLGWPCWLGSHLGEAAPNELTMQEKVVYCVAEMTTHGITLEDVRQARLSAKGKRAA